MAGRLKAPSLSGVLPILVVTFAKSNPINDQGFPATMSRVTRIDGLHGRVINLKGCIVGPYQARLSVSRIAIARLRQTPDPVPADWDL
ncbi:hypothetical protein JQ625_06890 [Bradyrhizobium diazoefficiens]|nr:hypothetical protein [Bradyrhizobium diazoefficiens]MBR0774551.1 hypothetical protein [Bradyrhizobium diazoefficiens]